MPLVLMYNIETKKAAGVKLVCSAFGIDYRAVEPEDFGRPIGVLLGLSDSDELKPDSEFDDEMLYLVDFPDELLNLFLTLLRKRRLTVALKAVKTETNIGFTSYELFRELSAEREAISKGTTAH